jgi:hypothetical protein
MAFARDLPIWGALALIGAGTGLHLGWGAIGEINPLYFSKVEAATSFHGDLVPGRSHDPSTQGPSIEQSDALALGSGCIGCRSYPVDYRPIPDPDIERIYAPAEQRTATPPIELAAYQQEAPEQAARRKADLERVELYARAPVTVEEVRVETASVETVDPAN